MSHLENDIMTVEELAEQLFISKNTAYFLLRTGEIKGFRIGRIWRVSQAALSDFIVTKSGSLSKH